MSSYSAAGIIVTAGARAMSTQLSDQLNPGGKTVIPIGEPCGPQDLELVENDENGRVSDRAVVGVAVVPMIDPIRQSEEFSGSVGSSWVLLGDC